MCSSKYHLLERLNAVELAHTSLTVKTRGSSLVGGAPRSPPAVEMVPQLSLELYIGE